MDCSYTQCQNKNMYQITMNRELNHVGNSYKCHELQLWLCESLIGQVTQVYEYRSYWKNIEAVAGIIILKQAVTYLGKWSICCLFVGCCYCSYGAVFCFCLSDFTCRGFDICSTTRTKIRLHFRWRFYFNKLISQKGRRSNSEMYSC